MADLGSDGLQPAPAREHGHAELFRVFALSNEFKSLPVCPEEKGELARLLERLPIPVKENRRRGPHEDHRPPWSAGRILRVIKIYSKRAWATPTKSALDKRMRPSVTPLRSFLKVPSSVIQRQRESNSLGTVRRVARFAQGGLSCSSTFSHLPQTPVQTVSRSLIRIDLSIMPNFQYDPDVHGGAESFHILVEEVDGTHLILPEKFPPPTLLLDLQPLPLTDLHDKEFEAIYAQRIKNFDKIQTQVFQALYTTDENIFNWCSGGKRQDVEGEVRPTQWDIISRRWRQRRNVQNIGLLIADDIQMVGREVGPTYEVIISRTRYVSEQTNTKARILAGSVSLANARDQGAWIGAPSRAIFNFAPSARHLDVDIHFQSFSIPHFPSLMIAVSKPVYLAISEYSPTKPIIAFADRFLNTKLEDLQSHRNYLHDKALAENLKHGIGYYQETWDKQDKRIVQRLFESGAIQVLVVSKDTAWSLPVASYMVIIMGVQCYEGKEHRYVDYPAMDVLQMMDCACRALEDERSRCALMCQQMKMDFYKKFLANRLPIESHLPTHMLHDYFSVEIAVKNIENKQDAMDIVTWTYFYRRMTQNPNYYNQHNVTQQRLSDHFSELAENTVKELGNSKCMEIEVEMHVHALNLGMIAAYYNISYFALGCAVPLRA
ncbi:hypothetical protein D9611_003658 [Ephemerocybe angulata]|uniref:SEC63 domain-containing protein n=1 Tax=Ephemerocybe angulata TaxID=980116 RepID=A0A8H5EYS2_9AGAR|nr:hypothetical protein D9611_003658 [Tulosesus angulatus]